jgi:hypothetical protein
MIRKIKKISILILLLFVQSDYLKADNKLESSFVYVEQLKLNYNSLNNETNTSNSNQLTNGFDPNNSDGKSYKSPTKAFLFSLAIPGLGQYYNGSRVKPFVFLGVEIISWTYHIKWHMNGNDITDEFEEFNRAHWSQDRYIDYLRWNYEGIDDDDLITAPEITHHLPDTRTQQYYEMTGKYDQFSWGWVDAIYNDSTWNDYNSSNPPPKIVSISTTPQSALREHYETRRDDANNMYDKARRMMYVAFLNRIVSAFEAMIASKKINKNIKTTEGFSTIKLDTQMKSYYSLYDTPVVTLKYKF